jgi:hypothetical protein
MRHQIRPPAVAGKFYPGDSELLRAEVREFVGNGQGGSVLPKALIAPHAGYVYSGPIAGSAYASLGGGRADGIRRVVMLGPAHFVAVRGIAVPLAEAFATPLGQVAVDGAAVADLLREALVVADDRPHRDEHSLEVHLPFLQTVLRDFTIVPLVVGQARAAQVEAVVDRLWGGPETLILISTDLSHYLPYAQAAMLDRRTADAIETLDPDAIGPDQACGRLAVQGALAAARRRGLRAVTLDLRNSGDTAGPRDQVVGYGAFTIA